MRAQVHTEIAPWICKGAACDAVDCEGVWCPGLIKAVGDTQAEIHFVRLCMCEARFGGSRSVSTAAGLAIIVRRERGAERFGAAILAHD